MIERGWTLEEGVEFVRGLQKALHPAGYHVALLGSVLHKGASGKDLDVGLFPYNTETCNPEELVDLLKLFGLLRVLDMKEVHEIWRRQGSDDQKHVEVWRWHPTGRRWSKRVDLFFFKGK